MAFPHVGVFELGAGKDHPAVPAQGDEDLAIGRNLDDVGKQGFRALHHVRQHPGGDGPVALDVVGFHLVPGLLPPLFLGQDEKLLPQLLLKEDVPAGGFADIDLVFCIDPEALLKGQAGQGQQAKQQQTGDEAFHGQPPLKTILKFSEVQGCSYSV